MKNSYEKILEDVFAAYFSARKHKRNTNNQLRFEINMEENLVNLARDIYRREYKVSTGVCFIVNVPVKREIFAADFRDRVVHHLLFNYISPIFEKQFITDCYSCRKGFGTLYGIERLGHHIRSCSRNYTREAYVLKLDIAGYFMSINKDVLFGILKKRIESVSPADRINVGLDVDLVLYLIEKVLYDDPTKNCIYKTPPSTWKGLPASKSLFGKSPGVGLPIGNLTSQLFSNIYLTPFDNFVKRKLRIKHYGRYVDDFYLIHNDISVLKRSVQLISQCLEVNFKLRLHPNKVYLQKVEHGVNFLGAHVKPYRRYVVNRTKSLMKKSLFDLNDRCSEDNLTSEGLKLARSFINSYLGYLRHFHSYKLKSQMIEKFIRLKKCGKFNNKLHIYKPNKLSVRSGFALPGTAFCSDPFINVSYSMV